MKEDFTLPNFAIEIKFCYPTPLSIRAVPEWETAWEALMQLALVLILVQL